MTLSELKRGCTIFAKYVGENAHLGGAEHDVIWFVPNDVEVSAEDKAELEKLGFVFSRRDGWNASL